MTALLSKTPSVSDTAMEPLTLDQAIETVLAARADTAPRLFSPSARQRRAIHTILNAGGEYGAGVFDFGHGLAGPAYDIEADFAALSIDQRIIVSLVNEFEFEILRSIATRFHRERAAA